MPSHTHATQRGITAIELIMGLAVLATLTALSLPTFRDLTTSTQARSAKSQLFLALNLARSRAVTTESHVVLCPSANQLSCDDTAQWHQGWLVFLDQDRNGTRGPEESIINVGQAFPPGIALSSTEGRKHIIYRADGSSGGSNVTFTVCDRRGLSKASSIVINNGGRPRQGTPTPAEASAACALVR